DVLRAAEFVDRLGDEAARPTLARIFNLALTVATDAFGLAQDAGISVGERGVAEHGARLRHFAAGQVDRRRGPPMLAEQLLHHADGGAGALDQWMPVARVGN